MDATGDRLRVTELIGSLSLAADLGTGQPLGHGLSTSLLAVQIAVDLGFEPELIRSVQQVSLLRFIGCTAEATTLARDVGSDDVEFLAKFAPLFMGSPIESLRAAVGTVGAGRPPHQRAWLLARMLADSDGDRRMLTAHCEVGSMLAARLGMSEPVVAALGHAYERWDGKGYPARLAGEDIPIEIRIAVVARDIDLFTRLGVDAREMLTQRSGRAYDPAVVEAAIPHIGGHTDAEWEAVLSAEPAPVQYLDDLDVSLTAIADFADLKSVWTRGHSRRVAELAAEAGRLGGEDAAGCRLLRWAGLVHDVGRAAIGNHIWDKPSSLTIGEWEQVRLHPYHAGRVLARCAALVPLAAVTGAHHERLDGSGYPARTETLTMPARILGAADVLAALMADRPHRSAFDLSSAVEVMTAEVTAGRLDPHAVACVVEAAGAEAPDVRAANPGGLSDREVEVLRHLARGRTNRQVAETLFISPKTVGRHVENIYAKLGVSTRAAAAVFAMEHRLVR